jgi:Peptidase propeptide and YPEB domain
MKSAGIALALLLATVPVYAQEDEAQEKAEAADAARNAPALAAMKASEKEGTPISGKFEVEDGKLQLSVYTMKGGKFFEVIVDHKTGKVVKTEPISGGEDLDAAKAQAGAMAKSKRSLSDVVSGAEKVNPGYRAVSVTPEVENGAAQADVALLKGTESKQVEEKL